MSDLTRGGRPRVLMLVQLPPPLHGASAVNGALAGSEIIRNQFDVTVVPIQVSSSISDIGFLSLGKVVAVFRVFWACLVAYFSCRPHLVYFTLPPHGGGFYSSLPLVAFLKLVGARVAYHFHGKGISAAAERSSAFRFLFRWATSRSYNILLSERLYADAAAFMPRERTRFLPNFGPDPSETGSREGNHILFLSNLVLTKGPLVLLDALAKLRVRGVAFRATFTGVPFPPLSADGFAAEIANRDLQSHVHYAGPVYGQAKDALLESAAILTLPTFYPNEAFPVSILEGMGMGLAIVATPEGAIADMVEDGVNGFLVPQEDSEALADRLSTLLGDPGLCRVMGERGRDIVKRRFSRDAFFSGMASIWLDFLGTEPQATRETTHHKGAQF